MDLDTLRTEAAAHQEKFAARGWFTVAQLAARWTLSRGTVRAIPRAALPYKTFGKGGKLRRYRPEDVAAYEASDSFGQESAA